MTTKRPLNDAWLFWDAERLERFPHSSESDHVHAPAAGDDDAPATPLRVRLLEDVVLYVAGISAAMAGVGFALLVGSFLSAYAALNDAAPQTDARLLAPPAGIERPAHTGAGDRVAPAPARVDAGLRARTPAGTPRGRLSDT